MNEDKTIYVTDHAYMRLRERNGWNRATAERMVARIYKNGVRPDDVKGYLKPYLQTKAVEAGAREISDVVIYGDIIYLFSRKSVLVTAYPAPTKNTFIRNREGIKSKSKRNLVPYNARRMAFGEAAL